MWEEINFGLKIFLTIYAVFQVGIIIWATFWLIWEDVICPRLISQTRIEALAADCIASYKNPVVAANQAYWQALYRSEGADQIKWRRIRRVITREFCKCRD